MKVHLFIYSALCVLLIPSHLSALETEELVIVILSQAEGYHAAHASLLREKIKEEAATLDKEPPRVILTHELRVNGSWTIFPLLPHLNRNYPDAKWYFFCLENTGIRLGPLVKVLSTLSEQKELWVGHALYDKQPTIIHHFADHSKKFKYPNFASGFAFTNPLLKNLSKRFSANSGDEYFSIDASYELATFVYDEGKGVRLSHVPELCVVSGKDCATYPRFFHPCSNPVPREKVFVAVKTYSKNHRERVPIIMKTWLKHVKHFGLFSNETDDDLPNIHVVPNTEEGHCAKTRAILQESYSILRREKMDWLVVVDDDTILSMARLTRLLTCYNPAAHLALGERYGFRMRHSSNVGYDYLTGGAGVVLSTPLVKEMIDSQFCDCPKPTTPDDMYLFGYCLHLIGLQPTHSPLFHQARPQDYATGYLASNEPVSFHKFWSIDPYQVYEHWFAEADLAQRPPRQHTEL